MAAIAIFLLLLPFFWFKPGEMDLGGDSSRLYFYDPLAYLQNYALYSISPSSFGGENIGYYMIPFVFFLYCLKLVFQSPTILIAFFHGLSFSVAFVSIYFTIRDLLGDNTKNKKILEGSAIIAGVFYVLSQTSIQGWDKVLVTHNQFFLNPLMFFLLLRYVRTSRFFYLLVALLVTFVFSPNFSFAAAPAFFAFYPLSIVFLVLYKLVILKKKFNWKHLVFTLIAFILLQSFHLIPQIMSALSPGSSFNTTIFTNEGKLDRGLSYFSAIAPNIKVSLNLMNLPQMSQVNVWFYTAIVFPVIIILGFLINRSRTLLLTGAFFLVVLFFVSANLTNIGLELYKKLFYLPGFSMFRNFYGQWGYTLLFFYTLLFSQSLFWVLFKMRKINRYVLSSFLLIILIIPAFPFFNGTLVNKDLWLSKDLKIFMKMDPKYEEVIDYVRSLPIDAKVLTLPLTDPGYQIVLGTNNGAYQGPSTISYLTGKKDFAGTIELGTFKSSYLTASKRADYQYINRLLTFLGVKYIFYNADPFVYEKGFPTFPYEYGRAELPVSQEEYKKYIKNLNVVLKKRIGENFYIYEIKNEDFLPSIYVSTNNELINKHLVEFPEFFGGMRTDNRKIYFDYDLQEYNYVIDDTLFKADNNIGFEEFFERRPDSQIPSAFISRRLDSFEYPLVVEKENDLLRRKKYVDDDYIDRVVFYADKRINELDKWSLDLNLLGNINDISVLDKRWKEPKLSEVGRYDEYNTWEVGMIRYKRTMSDLIDKINKPNKSEYPSIVNNLYMKRILFAHLDKLETIIIGSQRSEKEKEYLLNLSNQMYDDLINSLKVIVPHLSPLQIELNNPSEGNYDLYINGKDLEYLPSWKLNVKGKSYEGGPGETDQLKIENVFLKKGKVKMQLEVGQYPNLVSNSLWKNLDEVQSDADILEYKVINNSFSNIEGVVREINGWDANAIYAIHFDYNTHGKEFDLKVHEKVKDQVYELFNSPLSSVDWKNFQTVIRSSDRANDAYLQVVKNKGYAIDLLERNKGKDTQIEIKNLSVIKIPNPQIILKRKNKAEGISDKPKIIFKKINSTKYEVQIKDAKKPYTLVFLNQFNNNWNLYEIKNIRSAKSKIVGAYYNNEVEEMQPYNKFLDRDSLKFFGEKSIAKNKHFQVNGFANAWYIEPKDVDHQKDYTLILEYKTQQVFYPWFFISIGTAILVFCLLMYSFFFKKYE